MLRFWRKNWRKQQKNHLKIRSTKIVQSVLCVDSIFCVMFLRNGMENNFHWIQFLFHVITGKQVLAFLPEECQSVIYKLKWKFDVNCIFCVLMKSLNYIYFLCVKYRSLSAKTLSRTIIPGMWLLISHNPEEGYRLNLIWWLQFLVIAINR